MERLFELDEAVLQQVRKTAETPPRVSVLDVIGTITGLSSNNCSNVWSRLQKKFHDISIETDMLKFKGTRQKPTPVCTQKELPKILALLNGHAACVARATGKLSERRPHPRPRAPWDVPHPRPEDLYVMRYSHCKETLKIGSADDVEAHRASLELGQNFRVDCVAIFPGKGGLAEEVQNCLHARRCSRGLCEEWFSVSVDEGLDTIRQVLCKQLTAAAESEGPGAGGAALSLPSHEAGTPARASEAPPGKDEDGQRAELSLAREVGSTRGALCTSRWFSAKARTRMRNLVSALKRRSVLTEASAPKDDLYILQNSRIPGEIKIGRSTLVSRRRNQLQAAQNFHMRIHAIFPGRGDVEPYLHKMFARRRVRGVPGEEWFYFEPKEAIDAVSAAVFSPRPISCGGSNTGAQPVSFPPQ